MGGKIICLKCLTEAHSTSRHDFSTCECRDCFVDGGDDYSRVGASNLNLVKVYNQSAKTGCIFVPDGVTERGLTKGHIVFECESCDKRLSCISEKNCVHGNYRYHLARGGAQ